MSGEHELSAVVALGEISDSLGEIGDSLAELTAELERLRKRSTFHHLPPHKALALACSASARGGHERCDYNQLFDSAWQLAPHVASGALTSERVTSSLLGSVRYAHGVQLGDATRAIFLGLSSGLRHGELRRWSR